MCHEIKLYKKNHNFNNYFDGEIIDNDAETLLNKMKLNYGLEYSDAVPVRTLAGIMGFNVEERILSPKNCSGMIGISSKFKDVLGNDKIILLNELDSDYHRRFTLVHELAHYIFDYDENNPEHKESYVNNYITDEYPEDDMPNIEKRANRFAAAFLMPKTIFIGKYNELTIANNGNNIINSLSDNFKVPKTAVKKRIEELHLEK